MIFLQQSLRHTANVLDGYKTGDLFYEGDRVGVGIKVNRNTWEDYWIQADDVIELWNGDTYELITWDDLFRKMDSGYYLFAGVEARVKFFSSRQQIN